jgi:hypothetical protein
MGSVTLLASAAGQKKRGRGPGGNQLWMKRLAIQLAGQLPENKDDALRVLAYTGKLVREFICDD